MLCGWVQARRDHGKLIFLDLRDRAGITQVVCNPGRQPAAHQVAVGVRSEYVLAITGAVGQRPKGTENPDIPTGQVEIAAEAIEILNPSKALPFEIQDTIDTSEEVRLAHRYLDLRRPMMFERLRLRHQLILEARKFLDQEGFLEIETPMLTKSTPEGARDYLVPSRLNPGMFFALPQSPQLFKQVLMVSGMERYFQVARCFRDEDLRADRQPEFTQLDLEMSFIEEGDIMGLIERLLASVFESVLKQPLSIPFPRMSYREAQERYRSDKPDIRSEQTGPYAFLWVTEFPLVNYNETERRWDAEHHPFTSPHPDDMAYLESDPKRVRARAYDLVVNGVELGSGSIRIHQREAQEAVFRLIGMDAATAQERFGFLLEAFEYGAPPHGGIALGLDRLTAMITGSESIRDVVAFPKTQKAACPLSGAPSLVRPEQLEELGLSVVAREEGAQRQAGERSTAG